MVTNERMFVPESESDGADPPFHSTVDGHVTSYVPPFDIPIVNEVIFPTGALEMTKLVSADMVFVKALPKLKSIVDPDIAMTSRSHVLIESIAEDTKAVVAICVEFVPADAVGAVGVPVNAGDASLAYVFLIELPSESLAAFVAEVALPLKDPLNVVAYRDPGLVPRYTSESDVAVTLSGAPESW